MPVPEVGRVICIREDSNSSDNALLAEQIFSEYLRWHRKQLSPRAFYPRGPANHIRPGRKLRAGLFFREAVSDEGGDAPGRGRINVGQYCDDVSALRINSQLAVHPGSAAAVAEIADSALRPV